MRSVRGIFVLATALLAAVLLLSCAGLTQPPDPAKVRAQIAEHRQQEIELVRDSHGQVPLRHLIRVFMASGLPVSVANASPISLRAPVVRSYS